MIGLFLVNNIDLGLIISLNRDMKLLQRKFSHSYVYIENPFFVHL